MDDYRERYAQVKTVPMTEAEHLALRKRLMHPDHPVDVVLDTDTYNEIDDQYALIIIKKVGKCLFGLARKPDRRKRQRRYGDRRKCFGCCP